MLCIREKRTASGFRHVTGIGASDGGWIRWVEQEVAAEVEG